MVGLTSNPAGGDETIPAGGKPPVTGAKTEPTEDELNQAGMRKTACGGVYYDESNKTHYKYENGNFVKIMPSKEGRYIETYLADGSRIEKDDEGNEYIVSSDGTIFNETGFKNDRAKLTENLDKDNAVDFYDGRSSKMDRFWRPGVEEKTANNVLKGANDFLVRVANTENISDSAFTIGECSAKVKIDNKWIRIDFNKETKEITGVHISNDATPASDGTDHSEVGYDSKYVYTNTDQSNTEYENKNTYNNWDNVKALAIRIFQSKIEGLN